MQPHLKFYTHPYTASLSNSWQLDHCYSDSLQFDQHLFILRSWAAKGEAKHSKENKMYLCTLHNWKLNLLLYESAEHHGTVIVQDFLFLLTENAHLAVNGCNWSTSFSTKCNWWTWTIICRNTRAKPDPHFNTCYDQIINNTSCTVQVFKYPSPL